MNPRALWQGVLRFGVEQLPVRLYSALLDRDVHFHLLHARDGARLSQRLVNAKTGRPVASDQIRKGYPVDRDVFVLLDDEELASCEPEASRDIMISSFVPAEAVPPRYFERPYYLGPDGGRESDYLAFATALEDQETYAIAEWTMRKKKYLGAIISQEGFLVLITMRRPEELVASHDLDPPEGRDLTPQEKKLSGQLIDALTGDFDAAEYHDEYQSALQTLIRAKQQGKRFKAPRQKPQKPQASLVDSLRASVDRARIR